MGTASPAGRAPDFEAVLAARERIAPFVHRTPLLTSRHLGAVHGARILLKAENLQRAGAFKIRGALNALLAARERGEMPPAGAVAYSSGNHGQAVALAAGIVGVRATIVVPEDILPAKRAAIEGYGAEVIPCGRTSEDRRIGALEILEDAPELDAILVPVGGGGLISGISIVAKALRPGLRVVGAEPERGNDFQLSLAAGRRVSVPPPETIADGLRAVVPGELTFPIVQRLVDEIWTASDASIRETQRALLERRAS